MLSPPSPDREALEPRRVPGLPQCWPGLRRGQPLYPARARPCPRMRWPRPLPAPPHLGVPEPRPCFTPTPHPWLPASGSSCLGGSGARWGPRLLARARASGWGGGRRARNSDRTLGREDAMPGLGRRCWGLTSYSPRHRTTSPLFPNPSQPDWVRSLVPDTRRHRQRELGKRMGGRAPAPREPELDPV